MLHKRFNNYFFFKINFQKDFFFIFNDFINPNWFNFFKITQFYNLVLGVLLNFRVFRLIFSLSCRGQRTWSNNKTLKKYNNSVLVLKFNYFKKIFPKSTMTMFLTEYINIGWQAFWKHEWIFNKKILRRLGNYKRLKRFIDINAAAKLHTHNFYSNNFLLMRIKKKQKFQKKNKNLGFKFGFSKKFKKHLLQT